MHETNAHEKVVTLTQRVSHMRIYAYICTCVPPMWRKLTKSSVNYRVRACAISCSLIAPNSRMYKGYILKDTILLDEVQEGSKTLRTAVTSYCGRAVSILQRSASSPMPEYLVRVKFRRSRAT